VKIYLDSQKLIRNSSFFLTNFDTKFRNFSLFTLGAYKRNSAISKLTGFCILDSEEQKLLDFAANLDFSLESPQNILVMKKDTYSSFFRKLIKSNETSVFLSLASNRVFQAKKSFLFEALELMDLEKLWNQILWEKKRDFGGFNKTKSGVLARILHLAGTFAENNGKFKVFLEIKGFSLIVMIISRVFKDI